MAVITQHATIVDLSKDKTIKIVSTLLIIAAFTLLGWGTPMRWGAFLVGAVAIGGLWVLPGPIEALRVEWKPLPQEALEWLQGRFTKICVSVDSEAELLAIYQKAKDTGLLCSLIQDCGQTEFKDAEGNPVPTYTCCAIGPAKSESIDSITGGLKLL